MKGPVKDGMQSCRKRDFVTDRPIGPLTGLRNAPRNGTRYIGDELLRLLSFKPAATHRAF